MKTAVVIYNPNSGHVLRKKNLSEYKKIIEKHGYRVTFIGTQYHGHAKEIVSHLGYVDLVMSMGGDGTFNEVVYGNILRKQKLVLAHIPVGTTNDIGVMFGYEKDIKKNIELCLSGEVKQIDIPLINDRPFVYVAGIGKFLNIPYETPREEKKKFGHAAYVWNGVKDFFKDTKAYDVDFEIDGKKYTGKYSLIMIASATRIAGMNNFFKNVKLNDNKVEVLLCTYTKRLDIIRAMSKLIMFNAEQIAGIQFFRASNIKVKFKHHHKKAWCIDGEKLEIRTKDYIIKNSRNINILMPKKNIKKLFVEEEK